MIVLISESMLSKATATDGRVIRDRVLSGFGVRLNARKRMFLISNSVKGKQFRMMRGHWPLMIVSEAKSIKASSHCRHDSFFRTHFGDWLDQQVSHMAHGAFRESCHDFAQVKGASLVDHRATQLFCLRLHLV